MLHWPATRLGTHKGYHFTHFAGDLLSNDCITQTIVLPGMALGMGHNTLLNATKYAYLNNQLRVFKYLNTGI